MGHEAGHPLKPFASQSVVMLNVLQAPRSSQPFPYEVRVALVLGALLALPDCDVGRDMFSQSFTFTQTQVVIRAKIYQIIYIG